MVFRKREFDYEHFVKVVRKTTETPAYRALSNHAKVPLIQLKFEWKGPKTNNNGRIAPSVPDAAARNGAAFGAGSAGAICGWLHDLGKVKPDFQVRLQGKNVAVSHSGEGARRAADLFGPFGKLMAYAIAGHHSGLPNGKVRSGARPGTPLADRLEQAQQVGLPDGGTLREFEIPGLFRGLTSDNLFEMQFFARMLFSALVDADFIATEAYCHPSAPRGTSTSLAALSQALTDHMSRFDSSGGEVNRLRAEEQETAKAAALPEPGLFSLTVATGGGKTLASLRFALDHAMRHGLRRVIYVIPFTTIIEQTADVFRKALMDDDVVLEHHSAFDAETVPRDETEVERLRLAAQNWDRPVVVTTGVQFYESLFANRTQKCRKLHNIAGSGIVLDEAQSLPANFLRPCLAALNELVRGYGCSVVFCTATQPAIRDADGLRAPEAIAAARTREFAPDPDSLYLRLRRVEARFEGAMTNGDLAARVGGRKALVIVNNKRQARDVARPRRSAPEHQHDGGASSRVSGPDQGRA